MESTRTNHNHPQLNHKSIEIKMKTRLRKLKELTRTMEVMMMKEMAINNNKKLPPRSNPRKKPNLKNKRMRRSRSHPKSR